MSHPTHVFGYGSLVNRQTTGAPGEAATLTGWQRVWANTPTWGHAFLSIERAAGMAIQGLISPVSDWPGLDAREAMYDRQDVSDALAGGGLRIATYVGSDPLPASAEHPILMSYLDTVLQGFEVEFGTNGPVHFMETTAGWSEVINDRAAPIYPRTTATTTAERDRNDGLLKDFGVVVQA